MARPRGFILNPAAFRDSLATKCMSRAEVAEAAHVSPAHLSEIEHHGKGCSEPIARRIAERLGVSPATLFPELSGRFDPKQAA